MIFEGAKTAIKYGNDDMFIHQLASYKKMDDALAVFFWALGGSLICMCLLCCMIHYYCPCCYACCESKSKKYTQLNRNSGKMDSNNGDLELVNIENDI